ncbi:hypothetical protein [Aeromicrobium wangtongii]|uniref:DUF3093 domain-containing protein n=1 Tax=Aeromicrobium wangtongii TaxID=2969247 RepID=A0ABY5M4H9_9ACTN|nr:hypothetical protein [Aeromicrobium wangtongii]MCD9198892.1 hypothetical protein [Aeromicrobium wangtongii]UUP13069.1 hypothetical protein NQV15_14580 [Aeromicrobium wangtongii]
MPTTVHSELGAPRRIGKVVIAVGLALAIADVASGFGLQGWGVLASIFVLIVGITVWSVAFYGGLELTSERLVVGRERLSPDDFDAGFGAQPMTVLSDRQWAMADGPFPTPAGENVRVVGGSHGRTLGLRGVVLREAGTGRYAVIYCRRPDRLAPLLQDWLTRPAR